MADKRGFPFVSLLNPYIVVAPPKVYLREVLRTFEFVDELQDEQKRIVVPHCMFIQIPVVLNHPLSSILLWHKEHGGGLFRFGRADIPFGELFINKL